MKFSRRTLILGLGLALVVVTLTALAAFLLTREHPPKPITLAANVDQASLIELGAALGDYNAQQKIYSASLALTSPPGGADLILGPARQGGIVWRSQGWRLWSRLETLAEAEGSLHRPIIRPLREGSVDEAAFELLLADIRALGLTPLVLPAQAPAWTKALLQYSGRLDGDPAARLAEWDKKGWIRHVPDLNAAFDSLQKGKVAFLVGNDTTGTFLVPSVDNHPEGFPLPGSLKGGGGWIIGRAEAFSFPKGKAPDAGALDLLTWLTSKGLARRFAAVLPGAYYSWTTLPEKGKPPVVAGPTEFIDPER